MNLNWVMPAEGMESSMRVRTIGIITSIGALALVTGCAGSAPTADDPSATSATSAAGGTVRLLAHDSFVQGYSHATELVVESRR